MKRTSHSGGGRFRVWITRYERWQPAGYCAVPPAAVAVEPAEQGTMSQGEAAIYVEAFNRAVLGRPGRLWAVALPVTVRYEGDPQPGAGIAAHGGHSRGGLAPQKSPPYVGQASRRDGLPPRESA